MKRENLHHSTTETLVEADAPQVKVKRNLRTAILDQAVRRLTRRTHQVKPEMLSGLSTAGKLPNLVSSQGSRKAKTLAITAVIAANMAIIGLFALLFYIL